MAVQNRPAQVEFQGGAFIAFSAMTQPLQNKLYKLISQYSKDNGTELRNKGLLKKLNSAHYSQAWILRLDQHLRAIIQPENQKVIVLDILDMRLATKYFG